MLPSFTRAQLRAALGHVGVRSGSVLFVHSSLMHLGQMEGESLSAMPQAIYEELRGAIGADGTLGAPAPNWDYGRKAVPFDLRRTPVTRQLGVLSAHLCKMPGSSRSPNPIFSVTANGPQADFICGGGTTSAFGYDSAWDRLYRLDADVLFLGCDLTYLTFARYMEMRFGVPYLYNKLFHTPILDDGAPVASTSTALLRYMHCPVDYDLSRFQARLEQRGLLARAAIGDAPVLRLATGPVFEEGMQALKEDIHAFLAAPPPYVSDQVPLV